MNFFKFLSYAAILTVGMYPKKSAKMCLLKTTFVLNQILRFKLLSASASCGLWKSTSVSTFLVLIVDLI